MIHIPVLLPEILEACKINKNFDGCILDCTFGAGGYTKEFLNKSKCKIIALDADRDVQKYLEQIKKDNNIDDNRLNLSIVNYSDYQTVVKDNLMDIIVFDLGCSTMQLKDKERGFSFMLDGDLDMRMGDTPISAMDVINNYSIKELENIIQNYGEERAYKLIVDLIIKARKKSFIKTTGELSDIIQNGIPRYGKIHPATRTFQALRIYVNNELELLKKTLSNIHNSLKIGGMLCVVSFHSLEARIVKEYMMSNKIKYNTNNKYANRKIESGLYELQSVIKPSFNEIKINPSSRSAQLRIAKKII